ncbi:MAG TPA: hypothetical protein DGF30_07090 [Desulfomicrobium sp.]|nr:hypothetical protein [Desulfomicrobium sp.]
MSLTLFQVDAFRHGPDKGCRNSFAGLVMLPGLELRAEGIVERLTAGKQTMPGSVGQPTALAWPATDRWRRGGRV